MDTRGLIPRGIPRAQGKAGSAGAIQLVSSQLRLQSTTQCLNCPRTVGGQEGAVFIRPTRCSLSTARSVLLREFHEINLISSILVFPGS